MAPDPKELLCYTRRDIRAMLDMFSNFIHEDGTVYPTEKLDEIIDTFEEVDLENL